MIHYIKKKTFFIEAFPGLSEWNYGEMLLKKNNWLRNNAKPNNDGAKIITNLWNRLIRLDHDLKKKLFMEL